MILGNYWVLDSFIQNTNFTNGTYISVPSGCINTSGNQANLLSSPITSIVDNIRLRKSLYGMVGDGESEPTISDYMLESDNTSSFSNTSTSVNTAYADDGLTTTVTFSGTNLSGSEKTISEFGIKKNCITGNGTSTDILIIREVLEEPIIIPNGKGFSITFSWKEL